MAKTSSKSPTKEPKSTPLRTSKPKSSAASQIDKVSEEVLQKLQSLGIEQELQNDIEWCLGSYRADGNPVGLYAMVERALNVLKIEQSKKTKGITSKVISDLEKVLQTR